MPIIFFYFCLNYRICQICQILLSENNFFLIENENKKKIKEFKLNNDGRSESPILQKEEFIVGKYELIFYCGEYFKNFTNIKEPLFIDDVIIRFGINDSNQHYHVPLLVSPWSYSTYRGS